MNPFRSLIRRIDTAASARIEPLLEPRTAFYIPIEQFDENGYIPSLVTEGEEGHTPLTGGPNGTPWHWGQTYAEATAICATANADKGLSPEEVLTIIISSITAGTRS